ncbi:methyl-accepting chemotaxis protein [Acanthopleuribacter pedis]|uniref:Methyl-accepting chemotaxis protein n=1 Tax=Acanthopleuribacter pedis TaxID=442870 RepID=A0A8J7U0P7_9BACT|nr:methyl-accepting chemotaxis protein [Acanthopleuribacter pedis]MBO1317283.1 methyl-accepting chemotaxis protein [Acanthopleuribacter pedis]MBO1318590.1 methyl-accepting chemotaxis protein [Acanthopleuribacter pedis]
MQVIVGFFVLRNERATLEENQRILGQEYAMALALISADLVSKDNRQELSHLATQLKNRDPKVSYVGFFSPSGEKIADCQSQVISEHTTYTGAIQTNGQTIGQVQILIDPKATDEAIRSMARTLVLTFLVALFAMSFAVHFVFGKIVLGPLHELSNAVAGVAQGDLTVDIHYHSNDEIGDLAEDIRVMADNLRHILQNLGRNAQTLSENAGTLDQINNGMTEHLGSLSTRTDTVIASTEELTESMTSTTNQMEGSAMEARQIAHSVREMRQAINSMAESAEQARGVTRELVDVVNRAAAGTDHLTNAAGEITSITNVIDDIAEQTKLLALNATIEAARAGELGRGFGVVANEVKELARQTNNAIEEISGKIGIMQTTAASTADEMATIKKIMTDVDQIVSLIASAVTQQTATVQSISDTVTGIAAGINQGSATVSESAQISQNMSFDIKQVNEATEEVRNVGARIKESSLALTEMAEELNKTMARFQL